MTSQNPPAWQRSSFCSGGACVEIARTDDGYRIRDAKHPNLPSLALATREWAELVQGIQAGEFAA